MVTLTRGCRMPYPVATRWKAGIELGPVQRMLDDAHHPLRRIARQTRVGVERDAVSDRRQPFEFADLGGEAGVDRAAEQAIELLNLAAFPLPANPRVFRGFHCRSRWNRKKRSARSVPAFALRASTPAMARSSSAASPGASDAGVSAKSLRMAKWMHGSELPSASTSMCSISASTPAAVVNIVGTITMVACSRIPERRPRSSRGSRRGRATATASR